MMYEALERIDTEFCIDLIIEGEASGADRMAKEWARERGCPFWGFPAQWDDIDRPGAVVRRTKGGKLYDAAAGARRNAQMIEEGQPTHVLAMLGGSGTRNMIEQSLAAGLIELR